MCKAEENSGLCQTRKPPSAGTVEPVIMLLRSLSRKRMTSTTSSTSVGRMGVRARAEGAALCPSLPLLTWAGTGAAGPTPSRAPA